jgi:hypothetical protein
LLTNRREPPSGIRIVAIPGIEYLHQRAGYRESCGPACKRTHSQWLGWKGRAAFAVREANADECREDIEREAFHVWLHARYRAPQLRVLDRLAHDISRDDAWDGWRANYKWRLVGAPVTRLFDAEDLCLIFCALAIAIPLLYSLW